MKELKIIPFVGCMLLPMVSMAKEKPKVERPNILFILSDDHSREAISAYGGRNAQIAPTPNIDRIADNGALFRNMLVTNSISGPSRASLITGKYSTCNGFYQNEGGIIFDNEQQQYQMLLRESGYTTALFGKWHLYSTPMGFDHYSIHANPDQQGTYFDPLYETNGVKEVKEGYATHITTGAALEWLEAGRDTDKPFCMMLHYKAPHRPWDCEPKYSDLWEYDEFPYPESFYDDYSTREQTLGVNMATVENHMSRLDVNMPVPPGFHGKQANE
ncbi:MAG: sulfatase-like hydrolase/transferase, partial [Rikenellaceae bacterium]